MFSWGWGFGSCGWLSGPAGMGARLLAGLVLVIFMGVGLGPAISAAQGHGTRGYFVAQTQDCSARHGCTWSGEFRLPDGQVTRQGVTFDGSYPAMRVGSVVPALDTGDVSAVFARRGSNSWLGHLAMGVVGIGLIGQVAWAWTRRRRGAAGEAAEPAPTIPMVQP